MQKAMDSQAALAKLMEGNARYLHAEHNIGEISAKLRLHTAEHGQNPFAVIITCSDSRVIPEAIFQCGIGDLFVIRVAGNVMDDHQLGSVEYAVDHLGTRLVVVLGHTRCGAVAAALHGEGGGYIQSLTDEILAAIGAETDPDRACCRNVQHSVRRIETALHPEGAAVLGAVYDVSTGAVRLL